jgi:hypothetical protein
MTQLTGSKEGVHFKMSWESEDQPIMVEVSLDMLEIIKHGVEEYIRSLSRTIMYHGDVQYFRELGSTMSIETAPPPEDWDLKYMNTLVDRMEVTVSDKNFTNKTMYYKIRKAMLVYNQVREETGNIL